MLIRMTQVGGGEGSFYSYLFSATWPHTDSATGSIRELIWLNKSQRDRVEKIKTIIVSSGERKMCFSS